MKNIFFFLFALLSGIISCAQNAQKPLSGYAPFHETVQRPNKGFAAQNPVFRDITIYRQIAYLHNIYINSLGAWVFSDSGTYFYTPTTNNGTVYETGGNVLESINVNSTWGDSTQFTEDYTDNGYLLQAITGQAWNNNLNTYVNSYYDTFSYVGNTYYTLTALYQAWDTPSNVWSNVYQYNYTYTAANLPASAVQQQWSGSAWQNDTQFLYTYNSQNQLVETITLLSGGGGTWNNALKQSYTYDANGNNNLIYEFSWNGSAWVNLDLIYLSYNTFNSVISYDVSIYDSAAGIYDSLAYEEYYAYDYRDDLVQFENRSWDSNNTWQPMLEYVYSYDPRGNCLTEFDSLYINGAFTPTDQYYYYYNLYQVTGVNDIKNTLNASIFPNPIGDNNLSVSLSVSGNLSITMNIYDFTGRLLESEDRNLSDGRNALRVNLSSLAIGNYYLQLLNCSDNTSSVLKFVKN